MVISVRKARKLEMPNKERSNGNDGSFRRSNDDDADKPGAPKGVF